MNDWAPTPQEFAETLHRLKSTQQIEGASEREHWRRVFAASAISVGESCEDAVSIADKMLDLLRIG